MSGSDAREVVGHFQHREKFEAAIGALREAGFDAADLSVLGSHESLAVAEGGDGAEAWEEAKRALGGDMNYAGLLTAAGAAILAGGPMTATIAAIIAAGLGGAALYEVISRLTAERHHDEFARAVEGGAILLWVHCADRRREEQAAAILDAHGAGNVHATKISRE